MVLLSAAGKMFTSGIDLGDLTQLASLVYGDDDVGRKSLKLYNKVSWYQDQFTELERCKKPIIGIVLFYYIILYILILILYCCYLY